MFKRILVAIDGSEQTNLALNYAMNIADKYSASIVLLTVLHPAPTAYVDASVEPMYIPNQAFQDYLDELKAFHEQVLLEAQKKMNQMKPKVEVSTMLKEGRPADEIVETATEGNFDLIVIGSRGLGGIKQLFLGSVSDRVADHATCPVLIVR